MLVALALGVVAGCGGGKDKPASQVAARVNKEEITVHQVNHALQGQRLRPDETEVASTRVLEKLIDQELAVQKAHALKVDRDPKVMQQIEAARGDILARAYFERIAESVAKPTPAEVTAYYNEHPALFRERRIYQLQEVTVQAKEPQAEAVRRIVAGGKPLDEVLIYLRANDVPYSANQVVRAAEQVPMAALSALAKARDGQSIVVTAPAGIQVISLTESRPQPIDEERARSAIEQFLVNDRKRRVVADDLKALRAASKVEYVGTFAALSPAGAEAAPSAADAAASAVRGGSAAAAASVPTPVATSPASATVAPASATAAAKSGAAGAVVAQDAGALSHTNINKGLGLK